MYVLGQRFENSSRLQHLKKTWTFDMPYKNRHLIQYLQNAKHEGIGSLSPDLP